MDKLLKLALIAFTENRLAQRAKGIPAAAVCAAFAFFTALGTLGCAIAALWIFLAPQVGAAGAAVWSAVVLLLITAGLGLAAKMSMNAGHHPREGAGLAGLEDIAGELRRGMSNNKFSVLLAALIAGLLAGRQ